MAVKDTLEEQLRDVEGSYRRLIEEVEQQLNELEDRASAALDDLQDQLPDDVAEIMARIRDMTLATRRRMWTLSEQALEATRDAVETLAETTGQLARRPGLHRPPAGGKGRKRAAKKRPAKKAAKKTAKKPAKAAAKKRPAKPSGRASAQWSRADLYAEATRLGVGGRSSMSKAELARAINRAS